MKPEQGRLALSLLNVLLAMAVVGLAYRTFFQKHQAEPGEVPGAIDPQKVAIRVTAQRNKAEQYQNAWLTLDKPKPVEAPPPPAPVQVQPEDINKNYQLIGVSLDKENPKKSSVFLQKRANSEQILFTVGQPIEGFEVTKIEEGPEKSVKVTVLDSKSGKSTDVMLSKEQLKFE